MAVLTGLMACRIGAQDGLASWASRACMADVFVVPGGGGSSAGEKRCRACSPVRAVSSGLGEGARGGWQRRERRASARVWAAQRRRPCHLWRGHVRGTRRVPKRAALPKSWEGQGEVKRIQGSSGDILVGRNVVSFVVFIMEGFEVSRHGGAIQGMAWPSGEKEAGSCANGRREPEGTPRGVLEIESGPNYTVHNSVLRLDLSCP